MYTYPCLTSLKQRHVGFLLTETGWLQDKNKMYTRAPMQMAGRHTQTSTTMSKAKQNCFTCKVINIAEPHSRTWSITVSHDQCSSLLFWVILMLLIVLVLVMLIMLLLTGLVLMVLMLCILWEFLVGWMSIESVDGVSFAYGHWILIEWRTHMPITQCIVHVTL